MFTVRPSLWPLFEKVSVSHVFKRGTSTYSHFTHEFWNSGWLSLKVYISLWRDYPAFKLVHAGKHSWMYNMSMDTLKCWRHHLEKMNMNEWMGERIFWMMICITNIMWWCFLTWGDVSVCFISLSVLELNRGHFESSLTLLDDTNCTSDRFSAADSGRLFSQVIMKLRSKDLHLPSSFSTKKETIFYLVRIIWHLV